VFGPACCPNIGWWSSKKRARNVIGPYEADAITIKLQGVEIARPLTHDLLQQSIVKLGVKVSHILVNDLHDDTFYARIVMDREGERIELDARPSDAIALAVRVQVPIFVSESVMERAGVVPDEEIDLEGLTPEEEERLAPYKDFIEGLDLGDLGELEG
jgi:bifunctional DNase/RNase